MKTLLGALLIITLAGIEARKNSPCNIKELKKRFTELYPVKLSGYDKNIVPHGSEFLTKCLNESGLLHRDWTSYVCTNGKWVPEIPRNLNCWITEVN